MDNEKRKSKYRVQGNVARWILEMDLRLCQCTRRQNLCWCGWWQECGWSCRCPPPDGRGYKKIREELDRVGMPMPIVEEMDGGVLAVMKRFTIDEVIAKRKGNTAETDCEVGNLSGTCRELNWPNASGVYVQSSEIIHTLPLNLWQCP